MTARETYERQKALVEARRTAYDVEDRLYWDLPIDKRGVDLSQHPDVKAAQVEVDRLTSEVADLNAAIGGKVYRVPDVNLDALTERIAKLNKKAVKLATGEITVEITDERDEVKRRVDDPFEGGPARYEIIDFLYIVLAGATPQVEGYIFVATLDHEASEGHESNDVGIRRVPTLEWRYGAETAAAVEALSLTSYGQADNICDHCGYKRARNQTYLVYEVETGALKQIGSTCLKDYTGAHNPERIAQWAEYLAALDADLTVGGDDEGSGLGTGRAAILTQEFLAHVAACIREYGWQSRWDKSYGQPERRHGTADSAQDNIRDYGKNDRKGNPIFVEVTDEDREIGRLTLEWLRDDVAEREDLDEFLHNLVTYSRSNYVPAKGDGYLAYSVVARKREIEEEVEREVKAKVASTSEYIGEIGDRLEVILEVTFTRDFPGDYGVRYLTKGFTPEGNAITWWANRELEVGETYIGKATIKKLDVDSYAADAKTTVITNYRCKEYEGAAV